jgi:hypothetical protein
MSADCGSEGRGFESRRSPSRFPYRYAESAESGRAAWQEIGHLDTTLTDTVLVEQIAGLDPESLERALGDLLDMLGPTIRANPLRPPLGSSSEPELGG